MRPTITGQYVGYNKQGELCGVNLGYNFMCEHGEGTQNLVKTLNNNKYNIHSRIKKMNYGYMRGNLYYKNTLKKANKLISRWDNTPFKGCVLNPYTEILTRKITIRNSDEILQKYRQFQLKDNCDYEMLIVSDHWGIDSWQKKLGKRRIFSEDEILCMEDYQGRRIDPALVHGAWASDGFMVLFESMNNQWHDGKKAITELESAIENGCLAVVDKEPRMFSEAGCCLIVLDKSYGV